MSRSRFGVQVKSLWCLRVLGGMVMEGVWCGADGMCEVVVGYVFVSEN